LPECRRQASAFDNARARLDAEDPSGPNPASHARSRQRATAAARLGDIDETRLFVLDVLDGAGPPSPWSARRAGSRADRHTCPWSRAWPAKPGAETLVYFTYTQAPAVLLRDRDDKFGPTFDHVAEGAGARVIQTAVRAPNMNAVAERFVGSARREMLNHVLLVDDRHFESLLRKYKVYFNENRPHQGIGQRVPAKDAHHVDLSKPIVVGSVLGGPHVDYRRAA